jgi:hypothetical protein
MLGEKIGAFQGKITVQRVLPSEGQGPKFETTAEASGTILGIAARVIATYWSVVLPDGSLYGETSGPCPTITQDGDLHWVGRGPVHWKRLWGGLPRGRLLSGSGREIGSPQW